jgi:hypothetical protein
MWGSWSIAANEFAADGKKTTISQMVRNQRDGYIPHLFITYA